MDKIEHKLLLLDAVNAALKAGEEIIDIYESADFEVETKADNSPLTKADRRANSIIEKELEETGINILSEEGRDIEYGERKRWSALWVVDPLDGTKEFVRQNGEFTVNIALVENATPTLGVIYVPVTDTLYYGCVEVGAYRLDNASKFFNADRIDDLNEKATILPEKQEREFTMVGSRSHMSDETAEYFDGIREEYPDAEILSRGSSLKICMVAEGSADVYPRFAPTMEWDTCAGHAIAKEAGFEIYRSEDDKPLVYNKEDLLNPWFIVKEKM